MTLTKEELDRLTQEALEQIGSMKLAEVCQGMMRRVAEQGLLCRKLGITEAELRTARQTVRDLQD